MNTEYEIWTLMNLGLISNAMYMVAMVLLTWLGFRFAAAIAADPTTPMMGKITATVFYIIVGGLDIVKRKSKGVLEVVASWIGLLGGIVWCVGSIFLLNATANLTLWGGLWIAGSLLNLYVVTYDIVMLFKNPVKYLFRAIALALAWLANLLFLSGATHLVVLASGGAFICDIVNASGILISGAVMLFIHSVFQTLPLFMDNFTFSIVLARSEV